MMKSENPPNKHELKPIKSEPHSDPDQETRSQEITSSVISVSSSYNE